MAKLLIEFGPLIVFLVTYKNSNIFLATLIMILVTCLCFLISYFIDKKISLPLLSSGTILVIAGCITLLTGDSAYIKMKPTIVYLMFAAVLYIGTYFNKAFIKDMISNMVHMDHDYWIKLSKRFAVFFAFMAIVNEIVWRNFSENFWVNFKVFGAIPITMIFIGSQVPFLYKNISNDENNENKN